MRWFGRVHAFFLRISEHALTPDAGKLVILLLSIPCFKASHFFFKLAYTLQQRRLRLLCSEDFFLQFYDRRIATGSVIDILQSLRYIKSGLDGAEASKYFSNHDVP